MSSPPRKRKVRTSPLLVPSLVVIVVVVTCSIYANLSYLVTDPVYYQYFPPFQPNVDGNHNKHLGAEYINIAKALVAGEGYSNPFEEKTGPTAWMPPILPAILAASLWITDSDIPMVIAIVVVLQDLSLIATGLLCVGLGYRVSGRMAAELAAFVYVVALLCQFRLCFQVTHDCWLVLLIMDGLIAGLCWGRPLQTWPRIVGWGIFGGLCALINPIVAVTWALFTTVRAVKHRKWSGLAVAALCSLVIVIPWTVRNYLVFGRWMPVKSNAMYEFYQSQCLQEDGLLSTKTFGTHPYAQPNRARYDYARMGEIAFIDAKADLFWQAVRTDPLDFVDRVAQRFLGATLWYVPLNRHREPEQQLVYWANRLSHPLPFLALVFLIYTSLWNPLASEQWVIILIYACYLSPYVLVSYYDRYAMPLLGVKVMLVTWAVDRLLWLVVPAKKRAKRVQH